MQNRYVGDVGDFGKFGLLRRLAGEGSSAFRIGVVWYLVPCESHNDDGKHVKYLERRDAHLRECDAELFDRLHRTLVDPTGLVKGAARAVATIEKCGALPADTLFHSSALAYPAGSSTFERLTMRRRWHQDALDTTSRADLVFLDPDNGIECRSVTSTSLKGPKYARLDEIRDYANRGQSVIIYHHLDRTRSSEAQVTRKISEVNMVLPEGFHVRALTYLRGTRRAFLIAMAPAHRAALTERLAAMRTSPWKRHFV